MKPALRRHGRRHDQRGFTLIELTVSLMAGLIVAMGVVALSKASTETFHEEMRSSAAEANLRTAADRLRADLGRAGYMSTPNIALDPLISKALGAGNPQATSGLPGLMGLASLQLLSRGSALQNAIDLSGTNGLSPDALIIGGNMTTTDSYAARLQAKSVGGCQEIDLVSSPALYRLLGSVPAADQPAVLQNAFQPVAGHQFMVRVLDPQLRVQYLATCSTQPTTLTGTGPWQAAIFVSGATPLLTSGQVPTSQITPQTDLWVNPVQLVRWEIMAATNEPPAIAVLAGQPLAPTTADPTKYDLVRSYVDITQPNYPAIADSTEMIAEYATDLRVGFAVDQGTAVLPRITTFSLDDEVENPLFAGDVSKTPIANQGPQRIRSVSVRLSTRAAQPDRSNNITVLPDPKIPTTFLYRYCVVPDGCTVTNNVNLLQYARMRTLTMEVSMPNQSTSYW